MNKELTADIIEIFSSMQGEGPYIGERHIFIRFAGCNLNCKYCDTTFSKQNHLKYEAFPGTKCFENIENPVTIDQLIKIIDDISYISHQSISFTGGEPLLHKEFLNNFIVKYKELNNEICPKFYLETNGTLTNSLEEIIENIDIVSMDIKLESSTGFKTPLDKHKRFIEIAQNANKEIFAKIIITNKVKPQELADISSLFLSLNKEIPLIIQPVTTKDKELEIKANKLLSIQESLMTAISDVRIIPQVHPYLNLL